MWDQRLRSDRLVSSGSLTHPHAPLYRRFAQLALYTDTVSASNAKAAADKRRNVISRDAKGANPEAGHRDRVTTRGRWTDLADRTECDWNHRLIGRDADAGSRESGEEGWR